MTREELNECIRRSRQLQDAEYSGNWRKINDVITIDNVVKWLEDIRDNGITGPKKYTVQVIKNTEEGYLNVGSGGYEINDGNETDDFQTHFTQEEINAMKKNPELAIDWDKAKIEPVEGND